MSHKERIPMSKVELFHNLKRWQDAMKERSETCSLPHWNQCCCTCANHLKLQSHPDVDGRRLTHTVGWICAPPDFATEGFACIITKHGACEMWHPLTTEQKEIRGIIHQHLTRHKKEPA